MKERLPFRFWMLLLAALMLCGSSRLVFGEEFSVPKILTEANGYSGDSHQRMNGWLLKQVDQAYRQWKETYESLETTDQIEAYQKQHKRRFIEAIGGLPKRCPLNPRVTGTIHQDGYKVEKVIFESLPGVYVSAALFLPDGGAYEPPYPGTIVPCGHSSNAKAYQAYQKVCALAARNGIAALIFDPIEQGERHQWLDENGKPKAAGTHGHNMIGSGSILLGRNTARFEIWDGMRAIDYLQSRPEVDPERIGCTGNSGGGTQTSYLMALDDRIDVAAPACYLCSLFGRLLRDNGAQDAEQNIFGQLAFGMDHADYCIMRAPRPTLMCTATEDFFNIEDAWSSYRYAKRIYDRYRLAEKMSLVETDQRHGFSLHLREAAVRWLTRWLDGRDVPIFEPEDLPILTDAEIQATPEGEVLLLDGARSIFDVNRDEAERLQALRENLWEETEHSELFGRIRRVAGIRPGEELAEPEVKFLEPIGTFPEASKVQQLVFESDDGVPMPALLFLPKKEPVGPVMIVLHEHGKEAALEAKQDWIVEQLAGGHRIVLVELRGTGETHGLNQKYFRNEFFGSDGQDFYIAYLLGKSYVGMQTEDLLGVARWVKRHFQTDRVEAVGIEKIGSVVLHAAALEPGIISSARLFDPPESWHEQVMRSPKPIALNGLVHGALRVYDLPDLARVIRHLHVPQAEGESQP